jgi:hypothetical protein
VHLKQAEQSWRERFETLKGLVEIEAEFEAAIGLFRELHGELHTAEVAGAEFSFEDTVLEGLSEAEFQTVPAGEEHSAAWNLWHIARIEDITMNRLLVDGTEVLDEGGWLDKVGADVPRDSANEVDIPYVIDLSNKLSLEGVRAYRAAVGRQTQQNAGRLTFRDLGTNAPEARLESLVPSGSVAAHAPGLISYWRSLTLAGLLQMPPSRHNLHHLLEIASLREKLSSTP